VIGCRRGPTRKDVSSLLAVAVLAAVFVSPVAAGERKRFGDELSRPRFAPDRTVDVEHYRLDVALDPEKREVRGTVSITMSPLHDGLAAVELDAGPMTIEAISAGGEETAATLAYRHDANRLRIELPRAYRQGETLTLHIRYAARPDRGLYFVGPDAAYPDKPAQVWSQGESEDTRYWIPSFDFPSDRATSEEIYTVPADWTAIGNGELVGTQEDKSRGTRSFHYRMAVPHVSYLTSVIAGKFEKYTDQYDGIPVEYYVPPGTGKEKALRSFGKTPDILKFFSERTGVRYPYAKYAQSCAVDFIFGGMENISATTQTVETLHDERAELEMDSWSLVAHEAAHQWWGDLLTCADWSHAWLNEGFATYWENLWREHALGEDEFLYRMMEDRDAYLEEDRTEYRRPIVENRYTEPMDLFDSHLYPKGGWVLHMIRGILGDEKFFQAMSYYARTYRERTVETSDLRRAIYDATGENLEPFFDQWTRHGGHPEVRVTRDWDAERSLLTLHFEQTQTVDDRTPLFALPVRVAVDTAEGTTGALLRLERPNQDVTITLPGEPQLVRIDPGFTLLWELDQERPLAELIRALESDPNPAGRILAARDLAVRAPREAAAAALGKAAKGDKFFGVRIEAAKALGKVRGPAARDALVAALADADARVRRAAAGALGAFRDDPTAQAALRQVIAEEKAYGPVAEAIRSLAKSKAADARELAKSLLERESYGEQIRTGAIEALAECGGPEALATARDWTRYGKPPQARVAAVAAVARLVKDEHDKDEAVQLLVDLLDDPYLRAREGAVKALVKLRSPSAVEPLDRASRIDPDPRLRRQARHAITEIRASGGEGRSVADLEAEIERLREDLLYQSTRVEELERRP
jgi:aminopeptidase N